MDEMSKKFQTWITEQYSRRKAELKAVDPRRNMKKLIALNIEANTLFAIWLHMQSLNGDADWGKLKDWIEEEFEKRKAEIRTAEKHRRYRQGQRLNYEANTKFAAILKMRAMEKEVERESDKSAGSVDEKK